MCQDILFCWSIDESLYGKRTLDLTKELTFHRGCIASVLQSFVTALKYYNHFSRAAVNELKKQPVACPQ
jgi:hypothetical protein